MAPAPAANIVNPVLRKVFAVLFVGLLVVPAAAELCAAVTALGCDLSQHACCEGPRLTNCDCDDAHAAEQAEPAQRNHNAPSDGGALLLVSERPHVAFPSPVTFDRCHRAVDAGERLSLLSTLLI